MEAVTSSFAHVLLFATEMRSPTCLCLRKHREEFRGGGCTLVPSALLLWMDCIRNWHRGSAALDPRLENSSKPRTMRGRFVR
jgi:hypothetical protein